MRKYLKIVTTTFKEYSAYRLNFILWRLRMFISTAITFFLWFAVVGGKNIQFGSYKESSLLSYILFANLLYEFAMGTRTVDVAGEINNGVIINYLLKPVSFFKYYLSRDIADKLLNVFFAIFEIGILVIYFKVSLVIPKNILLAFLFLLNGTFISFFLSLMLSFLGFWTTEVWAPRFLFFMIVAFLSGAYFPLDLFPGPIYHLLLLTPFPYLYYLPTKILLGQVDSIIVLEGAMATVWVFLSYKLTRLMWDRGNKSFSFWGR